MKTYKGWSPEERAASAKISKQLRAEGKTPEITHCWRCGQKEGVIDSHNHDYSDPIKYLEHLCFRCHMTHHLERKHYRGAAEYWRRIYSGEQFPPLHKREIGVVIKMLKELGGETVDNSKDSSGSAE